MYQPYPAAGQGPPPQRSEPPRSVRTAIWLMYAGVALTVTWFIAVILGVRNLKAAAHEANLSLTPTQISNFAHLVVEVSAVLGVVSVVLWIWMAWANRQGKKWARIVSTVLFGIFSIYLLLSLVQPHALLGLLLAVVTWLVGLGTIVLLWNRESSAYFNLMSGQR